MTTRQPFRYASQCPWQLPIGSNYQSECGTAQQQFANLQSEAQSTMTPGVEQHRNFPNNVNSGKFFTNCVKLLLEYGDQFGHLPLNATIHDIAHPVTSASRGSEHNFQEIQIDKRNQASWLKPALSALTLGKSVVHAVRYNQYWSGVAKGSRRLENNAVRPFSTEVQKNMLELWNDL